jgi:hypothetical protein
MASPLKAIYAFLTRLAPIEAQMIDRPAESGASGGFPLPAGYDGIAEAKQLLRGIRSGALATLAPAIGFPFASLTTVATDHDGAPILLLSQLSAHTRNLIADERASLLLARMGKGDPLAHPRLTLVGRITKAPEADRPRLRSRFLARHPKAALYVDFGDFAFFRLDCASAHLNGGFAKAADYAGAQILTDVSDAQDLLEAEASALEHLNADHADALALYAHKLAGEPQAKWRASGLDPEGLDLMAGDLTARLVFPERIVGPGALRRGLADLAARARQV